MLAGHPEWDRGWGRDQGSPSRSREGGGEQRPVRGPLQEEARGAWRGVWGKQRAGKRMHLEPFHGGATLGGVGWGRQLLRGSPSVPTQCWFFYVEQT